MNESASAVEGLLLNQSLCTSDLSLNDLQACNDDAPDAFSRDSLLSTLAELAACTADATVSASTTPSKLTRSPTDVAATHQALSEDDHLSSALATLNDLPSCSSVQMDVDHVPHSGIFTSDSTPACGTGLTALDQQTELSFLNANNLPSYPMNDVNIEPQATVFLKTIDSLPTCNSGPTIDSRPASGDGRVVFTQENTSAMIPVNSQDLTTNIGDRTHSFILVIKNAPTCNADDTVITPSTMLNMLPLSSVSDEPLYAVSNSALEPTMATSSSGLSSRSLAETYSNPFQSLPTHTRSQNVLVQDFVDALDHVGSIEERGVTLCNQFQTTGACQPPFSTTISEPNTFLRQMDSLNIQREATNETPFIPSSSGGNRIEDFGRCVEVSTTEDQMVDDYQGLMPATPNRQRNISSDIDRLCETVLAGSDEGAIALPTCKNFPSESELRQMNESSNENTLQPAGNVELVAKSINCQRCAQVSQNIIDLGMSTTKVCLFVQKQGYIMYICVSELIAKKILPSANVLRDTLFAYNVRLRFRLTPDECHYVEHQNVFPLNAYFQPMKVKLQQLITLSKFLYRSGHVYNRNLLQELISTPFHSGIRCAQKEATLKDWINNKIPFENQEVAGISNLVVVTSDNVKYIVLSQLYNRYILQRKHHLTIMSMCKNLEIKMCQLSMTDWKAFRKYAGGRERILIDVEGFLPLCHVFYLFITTLSICAHRELIEVIKKNPRKKLLESSSESNIAMMNRAVSKEIEISGELFVKKGEMANSMSAKKQEQKLAERERLLKKMDANARFGTSLIVPVKTPPALDSADDTPKAKKTFIRVTSTLPAGTYCVDENVLVPAEEITDASIPSSPKRPVRRGTRKASASENVTTLSSCKASPKRKPRTKKKRGPRPKKLDLFTKSMLSKIADAHAQSIKDHSGNSNVVLPQANVKESLPKEVNSMSRPLRQCRTKRKQHFESSDDDVVTADVYNREDKEGRNMIDNMLANCVVASSQQKKPTRIKASTGFVCLGDLRKQLYGSSKNSNKSKRKKKLPATNIETVEQSSTQVRKKSPYSNVIADVLKRYQDIVSNRKSANQDKDHTNSAAIEECLDAGQVTGSQPSESSFTDTSDAHNVSNLLDCHRDAIDDDSEIAADAFTAQICSKLNDIAVKNVATNLFQTNEDAPLQVNNDSQIICDKVCARTVAYPTKSYEASPIKSYNGHPIKSSNASPAKCLNASSIMLLNQSPIKSLNASPIKSLNASPIKCLTAPPILNNNASPVRHLNASPVTSLNGIPLKSSNASTIINSATSMNSLTASPVKCLNATPMKNLNESSVKCLNASIVKCKDASLVKCKNASPISCKKIPGSLLSSSPEVRKICANTLIVSLSPVKLQEGRAKVLDSSSISPGSVTFSPRIQSICSLTATDPLAPLSTVSQDLTQQTISGTPTKSESRSDRSSASRSFPSSTECSPVKHGNSSTDLQSRLAGIDCNDSLQFLASVAEVLTDSADDVSTFINPPVDESVGEFNHLPTQEKSHEQLTNEKSSKVICPAHSSDIIGEKIQTSGRNTQALNGQKKKCQKSKGKLSKETGHACLSKAEYAKKDLAEQDPQAISTKNLLISLLAVSKFVSDSNGVKFRVRLKPEALQPIEIPSGFLDLRVKKQRDAFLIRFGRFVCRKFQEYRAKEIVISDEIPLSRPPQKAAAKREATSDVSCRKKQCISDVKSSRSDFKSAIDEKKVRLKSCKRKRHNVKECSDDVLQPETKRRRLKRLSK